jgi:4-diphosphocytidyl-2-C-methyl-D-erythritol kinase
MPVDALALPAHAKLNLSLHVFGVEPDGYHRILTRMQTVSLHDLLLVARAERTTLTGGFDDDLVLRAARELEAEARRPLPARFVLHKRIPAGAGMGGGSADAATALRGLARLHDLDLDLEAVAARVGADVPFALRGGAMDAAGRGERLRPAPEATGWFAVAWPGFGVSTGAAYTTWDRIGGDGENELTRAAVAVEPRLVAFSERLGPGWRMTGSGSAFFRPCPTRRQAEDAIAGLCCWAAVVEPVGRVGPG